MEAAQRALDLSPSFALGYLQLGLGRLFAGRAAQAVEPLQRGLRLSPHDPQAFIWLQFLAFALFLSGDYEEAVGRGRDAAASRPGSFSAHCILACSLAQLSQEEEAHRAAPEMQRSLPAGGRDLKRFLDRFAEASDRGRILLGLRKAGWNET
jgi:adenylate cyclase